MWINNHFRIIWIKLETGKNKIIRFTLPIPMYIFQEILDCFIDILNLVCFFIPSKTNKKSTSSFSLYLCKELVLMTMDLLASLTETEPYDLVDISTSQFKLFIKIR